MNHKINKKLLCIFTLVALCVAHRSVAAINSADIRPVKVQIGLNKSRLITLDRNIVEISQGNSAIADFPVDTEAAETSFMPPNQILIRGKSLGTTSLYLWGDKQKVVQMLDIEVTHDLDSLKSKLNELLPNENISVRSSQKNIVLSGEVSTLANMQAAIDLAQGYLGSSTALGAGSTVSPGGSGSTNVTTNTAQPIVDPSKSATPSVINLMSVGGAQQVMLDVKV
ncbi:MAG: pilus assembly protein N-terminal domain-containing protein, partial [Mucilaginibacter sp.]